MIYFSYVYSPSLTMIVRLGPIAWPLVSGRSIPHRSDVCSASQGTRGAETTRSFNSSPSTSAGRFTETNRPLHKRTACVSWFYKAKKTPLPAMQGIGLEALLLHPRSKWIVFDTIRAGWTMREVILPRHRPCSRSV